jgi:hypothetical protein
VSFVKKLIKVVAVVAAVALAIPSGGTTLLAAGLGVSAVAATAIVAGLMVASSLLNKPKIPPISQAALSRLNVSIDPRTPRKIVFGETAMACDLRDMEYLGPDEEYLHYFVVVAAHEVAGIDKIYFDDKLAWNGTAVQSPFNGYLTVATRLVGTAANAINISARMGSARRYTGLAYVHFRFKRTGNSDAASSPFASSIPSRITIIGRGIKCYDPRQDSTVLGGSGPMRANDQSTWTYGTHARNPACQWLTYLLGWKINGRLSVGKGLPAARMDMASFMAAANACDAPIALAAGGTQPRYRSDGIFSEADSMESVAEIFKATMNAEVDDSGGKLALRPLLNDLDDPIAHFGPSEILSGLTWRPVTEINDRTNRMAGQYVDPRELSLYQLIDYPEVTVPSVDGIERTLTRSFPLVQNPAQAQRTAKEVLQRQQYGGLLEFTTDHTGWRVQKYDIVTVTHPPLGFSSKLFRVAAINVGLHGQVNLTLREENAAIYAWDRDERPAVQPVAPTSYDYTTNPILMGIESTLSVTPPVPLFTLEKTWDGVVKDGQLPLQLTPRVWRGSEDITGDDGVSYSVTTTAGLNGFVTVDNANGSPTKGVITVADGVASSGVVALTVESGASTFGPFLTEVRAVSDLPPNTNSVGGGTDNSLSSMPSSGAYAVLTGTNSGDVALDVTVTSTADIIHLSTTFEYALNGTQTSSVTSSARAEVVGQTSADGGATWEDMGPSVTGSDAERVYDGGRVTVNRGSVAGAWQKTGLAAGTYRVRLRGRKTASTGVSSLSLQPLNGQATSSRS